MSDDEKIISYRKKIDEDIGLQNKRKLLVSLSILMLAINFTGATFKEANTFIFKIEFTNQSGLSYFLLLSVIFLLIRYYAYSHSYQEELHKLWKSRMMKDSTVFRYDADSDSIGGLLGDACFFLVTEEDGILDCTYETTFPYGRSLVYQKSHYSENDIYQYDTSIDLFSFNERWTKRKLFKLILIEYKYRLSALFKYRENLDLIGPYILGMLSIILTAYKLIM